MDAEGVRKVCFKCKQEKVLTEFYKHPRMGDGHLNKCKECTKKDVHEHRASNFEKIREYDRGRSRLPHRVKAREDFGVIYREIYPEKAKALKAANNAIRSGKLKKKPCEVCGATGRIEKHHPDYSKPLDVVFLCSAHHKRAHGMGIDY